MPHLRLDRQAPIGTRGTGEALEIGPDRQAAHYRKLKPGPGRSAAEVEAHQRARIHSAMVGLAAERGYKSITVRHLASAAGVSTRTLYKHYPSKESCFLRVHELLAQRVRRSVEAIDRSSTKEERARGLVEAIVGLCEEEPNAARVLFVEIHEGGPAAVQQAQRTQQLLEASVEEVIGKDSLPPYACQGVTAALWGVGRRHVLKGTRSVERGTADQLAVWLVDIWPSSASSNSSDNSLESWLSVSHKGFVRQARTWFATRAQDGNRTAITRATAKILSKQGCDGLSIEAIAETAGVSRRTFHAGFEGLEDCVFATLNAEIESSIHALGRADTSGRVDEVMKLPLIALCREFQKDPNLFQFCANDAVRSGIAKLRSKQSLVESVVRSTEGSMTNRQPEVFLRMEAASHAILTVLGSQTIDSRSNDFTSAVQVLEHLILNSTMQ